MAVHAARVWLLCAVILRVWRVSWQASLLFWVKGQIGSVRQNLRPVLLHAGCVGFAA